ncbi:MAG: ABC transporter permease, partial [Bacillota bacterium]|nr:ABC transporter permease [Bacillota bacterium]
LLTVSSGFFILSSGVYFSAKAVSDEMERRFVVAAFPTNELVRFSKKFDNAEILYHDSAMFASERRSLSNIVKDPELVEGVYDLTFSCGYSPEIRSLISAEFPGKYAIYGTKDYPYFLHSVIVAKVKEIKEPVVVKTSFPLIYPDQPDKIAYRRGVRVFVELMTEFEKAISLHPGYNVQDELRVTLHFDSPEAYRNAGIEAGKSYYFIGDYSDTSLARMTDCFVSLNLPPENARLEDHLRRLSDEELERERKLSEKHGYPPAVAMISNEKQKRSVLLTEEELREYYLSDLDCHRVYPYNQHTEDTDEVRSLTESSKLTYHSFPVVGTDYLERMFEFHMGELFLSEGRSFTRSEYDSGHPVCIISEQAAKTNNLSIGDKIPLSFFLTDERLTGILMFNRNPNFVLSHRIENRNELSESQEFKIIGFYRTKNIWNFDFFSITPNTVFIPKKAMTSEHLKLDFGHFQTIVINRNAVEEFQKALKESRVRESVVSIHDNGYTELKPVLKSFRESGLWLMLVASAVCVFLLLVYLFLFVLREKRNAALMISLGAGQKYAERKIFLVSIIPVMLATVAGLIIGMTLTAGVLQSIYLDATQGVEISEETAVQFAETVRALHISAPVGAFIHIAVYAASIWLSAKYISNKSPLVLMNE